MKDYFIATVEVLSWLEGGIEFPPTVAGTNRLEGGPAVEAITGLEIGGLCEVIMPIGGLCAEWAKAIAALLTGNDCCCIGLAEEADMPSLAAIICDLS